MYLQVRRSMKSKIDLQAKPCLKSNDKVQAIFSVKSTAILQATQNLKSIKAAQATCLLKSTMIMQATRILKSIWKILSLGGGLNGCHLASTYLWPTTNKLTEPEANSIKTLQE